MQHLNVQHLNAKHADLDSIGNRLNLWQAYDRMNTGIIIVAADDKLNEIINMYTTQLNPVQEHLLRMFEFVQSENTLKELKEVLFNYYHNKLENKLDEMW